MKAAAAILALAGVLMSGEALAQGETAPPPADAPKTVSLLAALAPWATNVVSQTDKPVTVASGAVAKGGKILSIPFRYKRTFRLKADMYEHGLFGGHFLVAKAGAVGFDVGDVTGAMWSASNASHVRCLFSDANGPKYLWSVPHCFGSRPDGNLAPSVDPDLNIPVSFRYQPGNLVNEVPETEAGDFPIDHDFALDLIFVRWDKGQAVLQWASEGIKRFGLITASPRADGAAVLPSGHGLVILTPDGNAGAIVTEQAAGPMQP